LKVLPDTFAVVRLNPDDVLPSWFQPKGFRTVSWTAEELSILCEQAMVPADVSAERDWRCLMLQGPFPFELTGILLAVLAPLAEAGIGIFALSTFDTDYVLVKEAALESALDALRRSGHHVIHESTDDSLWEWCRHAGTGKSRP
jgi:hypothetical protein